MTAEQLRNSILQEAISGRLVPQDPNDEPASVLLQHIREEKARLVKEGKLKKKDLVETPITDDEKPFEIPSSWIWVRYQDIADCALGKTKNPNQTDGELCPYLCSINVYWGSVRLNVLKEMLFSDTDKQKYSVENGDMLICEGGEAGRSAIYEGDVTPLYYQNALHRVRFYGHLCAKFYLYQMELYKKTGLLNEHIKGETIQHFVSTKLLNLPIPLPPLAEQKRIVAKLEELLPIVDQYGKAQTELDELNAALPARLRQSILQEAFSGSLTHADMSEWEYVILGDICNFGKCESVDVKDIPNDAWVLELEDIEKDTARIIKRLTLRERKIKGTRHKFQKGQLLYSKLRTYLNKVLVAPADGYCTGEIVPITFKDGISIEYMCHFMRSPFVIQYTASCGYGIKMPRVNPKQMNGIEVPLPPLPEQQRIVAKIEELFAEIDKLIK